MAGGEWEPRWMWEKQPALYEPVVRASRPAVLLGLLLRGLEFDSFWGNAAILRACPSVEVG